MDQQATTIARRTTWGPFEPLKSPVFRSIWIASLFSNFGFLMLGVGAAWEMTRLSDDASMVALVQTALMLPMMFVAVPAGAIADMFDRRKVALVAIGFSMFSGAALAVTAYLGAATPWVLLGLCFLIGIGFALFIPTWQASVPEQVTREQLPAAVALGAVSFNVARSVGPALGGILILAVGAHATFALNAIGFVPLLIAFWAWNRPQSVSRLPPESIGRAIVSGMRFTMHAPPLRRVMLRISLYCFGVSAMNGLAPLFARDVLQGSAGTYGLLLAFFGLGALGGALSISTLKNRLSTETLIRSVAIVAACALALVAVSKSVVLTSIAYAFLGATTTLCLAGLNISVQFAAPRWVIARALAMYQTALAAGMAVGAWFWGHVANDVGLELAMLGAAGFTAFNVVVGLWKPLSSTPDTEIEMVEFANSPEVSMELTQRSGPVIIEVDYDVDPAQAREFYDATQVLRRTRLRNGGFEWSIARDIANPAIWTERYYCPTWGDYLRMRARYTQADSAAQADADKFDRAFAARRVRRKLERPFGSVRWSAETPDPKMDNIGIVGP